MAKEDLIKLINFYMIGTCFYMLGIIGNLLHATFSIYLLGILWFTIGFAIGTIIKYKK